MAVEEKFGARYIIENFSRYIIASNNPEAVAISRSNRRYFVIEAAKRFAGNTAYFEPIWQGVKRGELINFVYDFLLDRNISKFNPFLLPKNQTTGRTAKVASEGIVAMFWEDVFFENPREFFHKGEFLLRESVYQEFLDFANSARTFEKNLSRAYFWRKTNELIPLLPTKGRQYRATASGNGSRLLTTKTDPERLAHCFADTLCIEKPEIEPLEFFADEELGAVHV